MEIELGALSTADVAVELLVERRGDSGPPTIVELQRVQGNEQPEDRGTVVYRGRHQIETAGSYTHGMRCRARIEGSGMPAALRGLVVWA